MPQFSIIKFEPDCESHCYPLPEGHFMLFPPATVRDEEAYLGKILSKLNSGFDSTIPKSNLIIPIRSPSTGRMSSLVCHQSFRGLPVFNNSNPYEQEIPSHWEQLITIAGSCVALLDNRFDDTISKVESECATAKQAIQAKMQALTDMLAEIKASEQQLACLKTQEAKRVARLN